MDILEKIDNYLTEKESYEQFFKKKLKKWGITSVKKLSKQQKVKFFLEVDREWEAKEETD